MIRMLIYDISVGLTIEKAMQSPKLFQLKKSIGQETTLKLICVIIKSFCDSIKASRTMDSVDILECAELLVDRYSYDSAKDFVLAFKEAKTKGMNFYNTISTPIIFEIVNEYMEKKSSFIEKRAADETSKYDGSVRTEAHTRVVEAERYQERINKINENKQLKEVQNERKEIQKIAKFIDDNIKSLE
jgi:hypothetical protein